MSILTIALNWHPIETAPVNGPYLLRYPPIEGGHGYWVTGGRRDTGGFRGDQLRPTPTHWAIINPPSIVEEPAT